ncbi:Biofilm regulatory protein A precursor [Kocuria rosea]|nr:Biofilm regulatory protein A precursor [Kocuria rosea]
MSSTPPAAHGRHRARRWSRKRWAAVGLVVVLLAVLGAGVAATWRLQSNLDTSPLDLGDGTGPEAGPLDILVMGTDTRDGEGNDRYGDDEDSAGAGLTDVMMLVHVSEDRSGVTVVSLPRDLVADIPRCTDPESGEVHPAEEDAMLNSAIANGGPGCTVATVNQMTGLRIDHFMLADFNAVKELSSTVGGVEVCVNEAVDDPKSGLELPAGVSSVEGEQALAFLRSRAAFGDGGDTSRIRSQQSFLASMARKIKDEGTLSDLPKLYEIADVATRNLHVDEGLGSVPTVVGLGTAVRGIDLGSMVFVTAPTEPYALDPNRLQLDADPAEHLFEALREDRPLTSPSAEPADEPTSSATPSPDAAVPAPRSTRPRSRSRSPTSPASTAGTRTSPTCSRTRATRPSSPARRPPSCRARRSSSARGGTRRPSRSPSCSASPPRRSCRPPTWWGCSCRWARTSARGTGSSSGRGCPGTSTVRPRSSTPASRRPATGENATRRAGHPVIG